MQILLCAATPFEIQPTLDIVQSTGRNSQINVCITGVGLLTATYAISKAIYLEKPNLIIQAGIGGSFDESLALAQTVVVEREALGDSGVLEKSGFKSLFDLGLLSANQYPWQERWLVNPNTILLNNTRLPQVRGISVNEVTTASDRIAYLKNDLGAIVESMEGAALHYIALQEGIPFLQLRSISNYVGERDKTKWKLAEAIESLNTNLQRILLKFAEQWN